jgi:hypothetical protein
VHSLAGFNLADELITSRPTATLTIRHRQHRPRRRPADGQAGCHPVRPRNRPLVFYETRLIARAGNARNCVEFCLG